MNPLDLILGLFYITGLFFNLAGVVGIIRLPDVYNRLHSSAKNTTLGSLLIIFGLVLHEAFINSWYTSIKLVFIALLLIIVSPVASHALARAAYWSGVPLWKGSVVDEYAANADIEEDYQP